ncbi:hypothetical protein CAEBREN_21462 [Caenorhabditis brenneri]|uniref:Uncharacterized protein n=1 Tax=Caenorhabditis brenneri TaxID=135651 RepID=G0NDM6_CAEBE|nr:hypothetical protein CAEBREN_21462 [Caenorhabditis brenneri]
MQFFMPLSICNVPLFMNNFLMRGDFDQKVVLQDQSGLLISTAIDGSCFRSSTPTQFDYVDSERTQTEILIQEPFLAPPFSPTKGDEIECPGSIDPVDDSSSGYSSDPSSDHLPYFNFPETNPSEPPVTTFTTPSGLVMNVVFNRGSVNTPQPAKHRKFQLEDGSFEVEVDLREKKVVSGKLREFSRKELELQTSLVNEMKKKFSETNQ